VVQWVEDHALWIVDHIRNSRVEENCLENRVKANDEIPTSIGR